MASPDARDRLLRAGERLIAERGVEVPLRDVAIAAGQRNNSAVHYHFGSRDGLIRAVLDRRQEPLEARRLDLLAEHEASGAPDDVRALVEILVAPMFHVPYEDGATHYARFLEQVRTHPALIQAALEAQHWPAARLVTGRLQRALPALPPETRKRRLAAFATVMFGLLADLERASAPLSPDAADVISMLVGLLTAPTAG